MKHHFLHYALSFVFRQIATFLYWIGGTYEEMHKGRSAGREHRFFFHWGNLNEKQGDRYGVPYHGRFTISFQANASSRRRSFRHEWNLWHPHWLFSLNLEFKDGDDDITIGLGLWPVSFHFSFDNVFPKFFENWWTKKYRYSARQIWFYATRSDSVMDWVHFSWNIWRDPHGGQRRNRLREGMIFFPGAIMDKLFGDAKYSCETLQTIDVKIPMQEGSYDGVVTLERSTWKRPRLPWNSHVRHGSSIKCDDGIPFEGKGENSWDCGEDALYSTGSKSSTPEGAVAAFVESVLRYRRKYDGNMNTKYPHPKVRHQRILDAKAKRDAERAAENDDQEVTDGQ